MANNIKGITIEIGGDTTKLDKALSGVNKQVRSTQSELREVEKLLKLDPKNTELLAQKQTLLKNAVAETKEKLDVLKTAEAQVQEQFKKGEASEEQYRALQREIIATEKQLESLEEKATESNNKLKKMGDSLETVGTKTTNMGKKLLPVTGAITALGGASVAAAMELDNGYDTIITKTGATGEALEELNEVAEKVFSSMPTEMDQAGTAVGEINTRFQATGDVLEDLSTQFIEFAEINGTDLNNSIGKVDKIMEQWNIDMSETSNVLGLITKKGQDTGISVDTLMDSVQKNGATFKEMGLNMVQSVELLAQCEANGVNAETAIAGLRKSIKIYTDEGKSTDEALKLTIENIKNAKTETEALAIAQEVFGTKGAAEMSNAIREGRIDLDNLSDSMKNYGTVVEDTFNSTLDPWDDAKVATNNLKLAAADLGGTLLSALQPTITKVVDKVKEFTQWFKNLSQEQKELIIKIGALVAAIGPALIVFGKLSTGLSGIIKSVSTLSTSVGGLKGVLAAVTGPVGIAIAAIAALTAGFVTLYKTNDEFKEKVDSTMGKVKESFSQMWEKIQPQIESLKESFMNLLTALQPVFEYILTYIGAIVNGVLNSVEPLMAAIQNVVDFVTNIINALVALVQGDFDGFFSYLGKALQNAIDFVVNTIKYWIAFIVGFLEGFGVDIKQLFSNIWNNICAIFKGVGQWFKDRFTEAYNNVTTAFVKIGEWFGARWSDITSALASVAEWFSTMFTNAYTNVTTAFAKIGEWFGARWSDITSALASVAEWFSTMFTNAYTNVTTAFAKIGEWFSEKWADIQTAFSSVSEWFGEIFTDAWDNIKKAFSSVTTFFTDLWDDIKSCFVDVGTKIGSSVGDAFKKAINTCLTTIEKTVNNFIKMINGVIDIINKIPGVSLSKIKEIELPRLAKGGVLAEGSAVVAEAGPELLSMVNGKAVVTPLTGTAKNEAIENVRRPNGGFTQNINVYSPKELSPYEVGRQTRLQTRSMILAMQRG